MLTENDKHQTKFVIPPSADQTRIDPIVKLIVDLLKRSILDKLANLLPVVSINFILFDNKLFLLFLKGSFQSPTSLLFMPDLIDFNRIFVTGPAC